MIIHPGDTVIFGTGAQVSEAQAEKLKQLWLKRLPGLKDVVIVSGVATLAAYREEEGQ